VISRKLSHRLLRWRAQAGDGATREDVRQFLPMSWVQKFREGPLSKMSRRRLIAISAALVAVAGMLAYELQTRRAVAAGSMPELIEMAPGDATFIAYLDLENLRNDPLIDRIAAMAAPVTVDRDYADFVSATGFDYRRDLDRAVIAGTTEQTLAIAEGRFDQEKIKQYVLRSGSLEREGDRAVYVMKSATPGKSISLSFLSKNRIAIAQGGGLSESALTSHVPLDPAMRERLLRVAGSPVFAGFKVTGSLTAAASGAPAASIPALQSLRGVNFALKPDGEQMLVSAEGECENPVQAQKLQSSLDFLQTILPAGLANPKMRGSMSAENAALAARLIQAAGISRDDQRVRLLLTVTPEMIRSLAPSASASPAPANPPANRPASRPANH